VAARFAKLVLRGAFGTPGFLEGKS